MQHEEAVERLIEATIDTCDLPTEIELWNLASCLRVTAQIVIGDVEVLGLILAAERRINTSAWDPAVEVSHDTKRLLISIPRHLDHHLVHNGEIDANVAID